MIKENNPVEIILYVEDQEISKEFYSKLLNLNPDLNVPGMTEFLLNPCCKLGLVPNSGIIKILKDKTPNPSSGTGIPRCELYLHVCDINLSYENALKCNARLISPIEERNWGDRVCYFADPDGHIIAFAEKM